MKKGDPPTSVVEKKYCAEIDSFSSLSELPKN
jgi:hypothetical protein